MKKLQQETPRPGLVSFAICIAVLTVVLSPYGEATAGAQEPAVLPDAPTSRLTNATGGAVVPRPGEIPLRSGTVRCPPDAMSSDKTPRMSCEPDANPFQRFLNSGLPRPLTARQKFHLAARNVGDPFNLLTIAADAAIYVGGDSHSLYGPGMKGWAKNSGVSLTQDMTAEFFVTFLVPSLLHQDPHYHRMPNASYLRRVQHCITQPVWAQSDTGRPMPNYAYIFGIAAADTISNIYVPGREQGTWPTTTRVAVALGSAPIDNFITEFLPDVARHVSVRIVLIQRVIDRVALVEGQPN